MSGKKTLVVLILMIFTFTMTGCDIFNGDAVSTLKTGEGLSISQVQNIDKLYVDPGTEETDVINKLNIERNKVDVVLSDGSEVEAEIAWKGSNGDYNPEELGTYEYEGTALYNNLSTDIYVDVEVDNGYTLTLEIKGEGEILDKEDNIILSAPDNKKDIRYEPGSVLQLTAVPHGNWVFRGWKAEQDINQFTVEITMDQHKQLQAVFGNIEVFDVESDSSTVNYYVRGKLENLIGSTIEYVEIQVELYDKEHNLITTKINVKEDIAEGEIVEWGVSGYAYSISSYEIYLRNIQLGE